MKDENFDRYSLVEFYQKNKQMGAVPTKFKKKNIEIDSKVSGMGHQKKRFVECKHS